MCFFAPETLMAAEAAARQAVVDAELARRLRDKYGIPAVMAPEDDAARKARIDAEVEALLARARGANG